MSDEWKKESPHMKGAPKKCEEGRFCRTLENALGDTGANEHKKGLVPIEVTNFETGDSRLIGLAYKKSASDRGVMLNHCPFCGKNVLWAESAKTKAA